MEKTKLLGVRLHLEAGGLGIQIDNEGFMLVILCLSFDLNFVNPFKK